MPDAKHITGAFERAFGIRTDLEERQPGVLTCKDDICVFDRSVVDGLKLYAETCPNRRARILLHGDEANSLHEMLIAAPAFTVWPPLLNDRAPQSWLVIDGELAFIRYTPPGEIAEIVVLSAADPDRPSFLRFAARDWYTTVPMGGMTVYLETKPGPHRGSVAADWGAQSNEDAAGKALIEKLRSIA